MPRGKLFRYRLYRLHFGVTLTMKNMQLKKLITREKRGYLFASLCSALAALLLFYKLFLNDLYMKILGYPMIAAVLFLLILGNTIHGFFAFRSHQSLGEESNLKEVIDTKKTFYKSMFFNFLIPYLLLILLFTYMREFVVATIAGLLFIMMISGCYFLDLKPTLYLKNKKESEL